ncbi:MAG: hypothetical protein N4A31_05390 [Rickettsiales bacterium]|jgi:hypothetical protein|nr:hypothetical protein [Rickettsiales bacterium]
MTYNNTKNYIELYKKNLLLGLQVGEAVSIVAPISTPFPLHTQPFYNRIVDVGAYNVIQDQFYSPINATLPNIPCLGMLQTAKYLPNLLIQNSMKEMLYNKDDFIGVKAAKTFAITSTGMTVFFSIGAIENIITDLAYKTSFVYSVAAGSIGYYAYSWMGNVLTESGAINLSPISAIIATTGLVGSFLAPYAIHELGIDKINPIKLLEYSTMTSMLILSKNNIVVAASSIIMIDTIFDNEIVKELEETEVLGFKLVNILGLSAVTGAKLITSSYDDAVVTISKLAAFSFAKATAVTGIQFISDYKEDICTYPIIDSACEFLGITDAIEISVEN